MATIQTEQTAAASTDQALRGLPLAFAALVQNHMDMGQQYLCPELRTFQASRIVPFWQAVEAACGGEGPPYWGWSWPGSVALARYVLDHPELVRGKNVLDLGAGNGLSALASMYAGAKTCIANDIDPIAMYMVQAHLQLNDAIATLDERNLLNGDPTEVDCDVILVGDLFYARELAQAATPWLHRACDLGRLVLIGEPGRNFQLTERITVLDVFDVQVSWELESQIIRTTRVLQMR